MEIEAELDAIRKVFKDKKNAISRENSTRLKHLITSVDGKQDRGFINNFVDKEFLSVDSNAFRNYVAEKNPNLEFTATTENSMGEREEVAVPMTAKFFWPNATI